VKINYNGELEEYIKSRFGDDGSRAVVGAMPLIKNVALPGINISTDVINEYNRHRINQQRLDWQPARITFHDIVGGLTLRIWSAYYEYYFHDGNPSTLAKQLGRTNPLAFESEQFGYNISQVQNQKYLFKSIDIYQVQGRRVNKTTLFNPRISSFDHDTLAYDSSQTVEVNMTFEYEWLEYKTGLLLDTSENAVNPEIDSDAVDFFDLSTSGALELQEFTKFAQTDLSTRVSQPAEEDVDQTPFSSIGNSQTPLELLRNTKREAQGVLGRAASASALFNQIQIDVLGVDEPIVEAPEIRDFSAVINRVPTSYPDIRRVARDINN
jgi:hypothetical protein